MFKFDLNSNFLFIFLISQNKGEKCFIDLLKRAQNFSLDDQRGRLNSNHLEIPEFLLKNSSSSTSSKNQTISQRDLTNNSAFFYAPYNQTTNAAHTIYGTLGRSPPVQIVYDDAHSSSPTSLSRNRNSSIMMVHRRNSNIYNLGHTTQSPISTRQMSHRSSTQNDASNLSALNTSSSSTTQINKSHVSYV
jgi:hypothetical protein